MSTKIRKQIYIEPEQETLLKEIAAETGLTEGQIIRDAISRHTEDTRQPLRRQAAWARVRSFVQSRSALGPVEEGRTWRREDLYDL